MPLFGQSASVVHNRSFLQTDNVKASVQALKNGLEGLVVATIDQRTPLVEENRCIEYSCFHTPLTEPSTSSIFLQNTIEK